MKPKFRVEFQKPETQYRKIENEYISLVVKALLPESSGSSKQEYYKLVFPEGCGRDLMIHKSGPLKGLKTTSIIKDGKIDATAGLETATLSESSAYELLSLALFGMVSSSLSYITNLTNQLYKIKIHEKQAKFERITYIVKNSFEILPELLNNDQLRASYLNQIVGCNSDSYELYVYFREQFKERCETTRN